jgi:DNA-binding NarL/FixJ family response regulator
LEKVLSSVLARSAEQVAAGPTGPEQTGDELYERVRRLLSKRQMRVFALIGEGKTNLEIAETPSHAGCTSSPKALQRREKKL